MILKEMSCQAAVEECQVPSKIAKEVDDERQRDSSRKQQRQQESEGSVDRYGRPTCTTCTEVGAVDRPGRPTVGFWVKSADPLYEVFKPMLILGFCISAKKY